jgi:hypothetical protein
MRPQTRGRAAVSTIALGLASLSAAQVREAWSTFSLGRSSARRSIILRHALRNPGLGSLPVRGTLDHDVPVVQGLVIYFTLIVVAVTLLVDIGYALLDPRARAVTA